MKKKFKVLYAVISITIISGMLSGCGTEKKENSKENTKKKYIIATDATYAPFEFEKDGKYVGIDMDLLEAISKAEGFEYELKPMNFKGIIPAITSNQIDGAIAGINISEERKKVLDFSEGYYESGLSVVAKAGNDKVNSLEDLKGKTFAVKKGTYGSKFAEDNKEKYNSVIKYFDNTPAMFQEVINGNADVTFEDYPVIAYKVSIDSNSGLKIVGNKISSDFYGFAVKKGSNKELIDMFNSGLKKIKDSGEYDKIISKYINISK